MNGMYNMYGMSGLSGGVVLLLGLVLHIINSYPLYLLAKKAEYEYTFFAFIPILNTILMINIGGMSGWYILLSIVPIVNIFFVLYLGYRFFISYESGLMVLVISIMAGLLAMVIPFAGLGATIALWWLALSDNPYIGTLYSRNDI